MRARLSWVLGIAVAVFLVFYLGCVHYTSASRIAIVRNQLTGEFWIDSVPGFNLSAPWIKVARIDIRPQRVCVVSSGRSINCKLVQFDPKYYLQFVAIEGVRYYWWGNRISYNGGYSEEYRGMKDLLRGYAFANTQYPFIKILKQY